MKKTEIRAFATLIGRNLLDRCAQIIDCFPASVIPRRGKLWYLQTNKFSLDTICGELHITIYDGWLACRFQDIQRARQNLPMGLQANLNPFSGKWNFHYFDWTPQDAAGDFEHVLARILLRNAAMEGVSA